MNGCTACGQSPAPRLILASASPRRRQFLQELGCPFRVLVAQIDETRLEGESPRQMVQRLAASKAQAAARRLAAGPDPAHQGALIVGADTTVALGDRELGKPADAQEARHMLRLLGREPHQVHSAVSVLDTRDGGQQTQVNTTQVTMRAYSEAEIDAYVATGDPMDKAGAYGIQHRSFAPVAALEGCPAAVMGLPLAELVQMLGNAGLVVDRPLWPLCRRLIGRPCCQEAETRGGAAAMAARPPEAKEPS